MTTNEDSLFTYSCAVDTFATGAVNAAAIADGAVGASEIASGAVDAGDMATTGTIADDKVFVADSSTAGTWRTITNCTDTSGQHINYTQSTNSFSCGTSGDGSGTAATQAEMESASSTTVFATPGRTQYHPGVAKVWAHFSPACNLSASLNVSSCTDNGTGDWTITVSTAFSATDANAYLGTSESDTTASIVTIRHQSTTTFDVNCWDVTGTRADPTSNMDVVGYGDQG